MEPVTPLFEKGERVYHRSKNSLGTVVGFINSADPKDIRAQGHRYLIMHSGWLWSVPEVFLTASTCDPSKAAMKHED